MMSTVMISDSLDECLFVADNSRAMHGETFYSPPVLSHRTAPEANMGRKPGQGIYYY